MRLFVMGPGHQLSSSLLSLVFGVRAMENFSAVSYSIWIILSSQRPRRRIPTSLNTCHKLTSQARLEAAKWPVSDEP